MQIRVFIQGAARPCHTCADVLDALRFMQEHNYAVVTETRTQTGIDVVVCKTPNAPGLARWRSQEPV